jgi:hypothetical protein
MLSHSLYPGISWLIQHRRMSNKSWYQRYKHFLFFGMYIPATKLERFSQVFSD